MRHHEGVELDSPTRKAPAADGVRHAGFDLAALGWRDEDAEQLEPGHEPGRVVTVHRGELDVATHAGTRRVRIPGRFVHEGIDVAVGDWVALADDIVESVLPRRSAIVRNAAGSA